jgi:hypothetical protein
VSITLDCTVEIDPRLAAHEMPGGVIELEDGARLPRVGDETVFMDDGRIEWPCRVASIQKDREDHYVVMLIAETEPPPRLPRVVYREADFDPNVFDIPRMREEGFFDA